MNGNGWETQTGGWLNCHIDESADGFSFAIILWPGYYDMWWQVSKKKK